MKNNDREKDSLLLRYSFRRLEKWLIRIFAVLVLLLTLQLAIMVVAEYRYRKVKKSLEKLDLESAHLTAEDWWAEFLTGESREDLLERLDEARQKIAEEKGYKSFQEMFEAE